MKTRLKMYFQQFIGHIADHEEETVGIDAMLGYEVVKFLAANPKNCKLARQGIVSFKQHAIRSLDEHELAML